LEQWFTHAMERENAQLVQGLGKSEMSNVAYVMEVVDVGAVKGLESVRDARVQVGLKHDPDIIANFISNTR